jgi:Response regulator containing CheY-like receiver domain and AraC-type DNA-binding domain
VLKVVLVDDEDIIREGLSGAINWEKLGFSIVRQAEDGEQALQAIAETVPDVVITDIKMPFVDGLQLIEAIKPKYPQLYIIIISGHDEFQYAQKAVKLGAFDYILKPIDLEYLETILKNIKSDYERRQQKAREVLTLKEKIANNIPLLREQFFWDIINENIDKTEIAARTEDLKIDPQAKNYGVIIAQFDDYYIITGDMDDSQRRGLEKSFEQLITALCAEGQSVVLTAKAVHETVIVIWGPNTDEVTSAINGLSANIRKRVNELGQYTVTVGIGTVVDSVHSLAKSYRQANEVLDYKFILGKNRELYYKDLDLLPKHNLKFMDYDETALISAIKLGDKNAVQERLASLVEILKKNGGSYLYMQIMVGEIYMQALKILKEAGGLGEEVFNDPLEIYQKMIAYQTVEDITGQLAEALGRIIDYIYMRRSNKFYQTIEKAKEYLKLNYAKDDLTLEDVAKHVNMGPSYFSFTFKQEVGTNFVDFLNHIRLEKAKQLLMVSDCKSYEVSYQVGYNNPTYFSTIFKKYVGVSPTEYKNQFKGETTTIPDSK